MPIIKLTNGEFKRVSYGSAAQLNTYLNEPEKLSEIKDDAARKVKEDFLSTVESIDWSDVSKKRSVQTGNVKHNPEVQRVLNDKSLTGKAKFDAMRIALTGRGADGKEPKFDDIP